MPHIREIEQQDQALAESRGRSMSEEQEDFDFFSKKEDALDTMASLLQLALMLARRHDVPFLAVFQPNKDWLTPFKHLPDSTGSELKAAWYEINQEGET